jgi:hypothetical protein
MPNNRNFGFSLLFCLVLLCATVFLNVHALHYEPLLLWTRTIPFILILIGLGGILREIKALMLVGWIGIFVFSIICIGASFPSEDYVLGRDSTNLMSGFRVVDRSTVAVKLVTGITISVLLACLYHRLSRGLR